jgi:hypothetical protein
MSDFQFGQRPYAPEGSGVMGRVFYVDEFNGDNGNEGIDPSAPFATITYALTQCVDDRNDYIIVLDCYDQDTYPIVINKSMVHIIGRSKQTILGNRWPLMNGGGGTGVFQIGSGGKGWVEIAGFAFGNAGGPCILASGGACMGSWIHHCVFGETLAAQDGILGDAPDRPNFTTIEDCIFAGLLTRDGIRGPTLTKCVIRNNIFREYAGVGVNITGDGEPLAVIGNYFYVPIADSAAAGWAITTNGHGCIFAHNFATQTGDNTGNNPYRDLSTGVLATCLNGWVANYAGNALSPGPAIA